ncbi:MAG: dienelactone hydrolase family protein [Flavobacteriales bacterium]|nr:dienelactone hydrolase family protein [Flavobacteriales bacterium]
MKTILILTFLFSATGFAQNSDPNELYIHKTIIKNEDTIRYHVYSKRELKEQQKILLFFHGSGGEPLYSKVIVHDTIQVMEDGKLVDKVQKKIYLGSSVPLDLNAIPEDCALVVISKKGVPFWSDDEHYSPQGSFYEFESLDYRVWQGDEVINDLLKKHIKKPSHVMILGHSEGSDVVAKLGHVNKQITHVGFFAGGGNTQYYDFALFIQKEVQRGNITQEEANLHLDTLFSNLKEIEADPNSTTKQWYGHAYRRWSHFNEAPIDNLLKIDKPLFVAVAGQDQSVPVESSLLIPIEFIRHHKENLTYKIYPNYDHGFSIPPKNETERWEQHFQSVFEAFMEWAN